MPLRAGLIRATVTGPATRSTIASGAIESVSPAGGREGTSRSSASSRPSTTAPPTSRSASRACSRSATRTGNTQSWTTRATTRPRRSPSDSRHGLAHPPPSVRRVRRRHRQPQPRLRRDQPREQVLQGRPGRRLALSRMPLADGRWSGRRSTIGVVASYQLWGRRVFPYGLPYSTTFSPAPKSSPAPSRRIQSARIRPRHCFAPRTFGSANRSRDGFRHDDTEAGLWMLSRHDFAFVHQVLTFARRQPRRESDWADTMNSYEAEEIVFLLRYGGSVLDDAAFRTRLRALAQSYVYYHVRQVARVSRLRDPSSSSSTSRSVANHGRGD